MNTHLPVSPTLRWSFHTQALFGHIKFVKPFAVAAMVVCMVIAARGATASFSTTAPTLGPSDLSQLANAPFRTNNVANGDDDNAVYIDSGRPIQGQTFTTGPNANGYALTAVTLKQVAYDTYAFVPDMSYHIRIAKPSGSALTVLAEETAFVPEDVTDCATCNFKDNGCCALLPGSGRYIT